MTATILATVRQSPRRVIAFASDDDVYVLAQNDRGTWNWYGSRGDMWCVMAYRTYASALRSLRAWLALRFWFCVDVTTGEGAWMTYSGAAARWVDYL